MRKALSFEGECHIRNLSRKENPLDARWRGRNIFIRAIRGVLRVGLALGEGNVIGGSVPLFQRHRHSLEDF